MQQPDRSVETSPVPAEQLAFAIRPAEPGDLNFIFDSWLRSWAATLDIPQKRRKRFFDAHRPQVLALLQRCPVLAAVDPDAPAEIFGWACTETGAGIAVAHFVYVKRPYRQQGIASALLDAAGASPPLLTTHWGHECSLIAVQRPGLLRYIGVEPLSVSEPPLRPTTSEQEISQ